MLLENTAQKQRKGGKLEPGWLGPYTVNRCVGKGLYQLWRDGKVVKSKANVGRLKEYRKRLLDDNEDDNKERCFSPMKIMKVCVCSILKQIMKERKTFLK